MATTNLQVNAQTSSAVGAFNQLAQSIATAQAAFNQLSNAAAQATTQVNAFGDAMTGRLRSGVDFAKSAFSGLMSVLEKVGAGIEFVFSSLLKEIDKLQGFNAMMTVSMKSSDAAADSYNFLRTTADKLGIQFDALTANYGKLLASIPDGVNKFDQVNRAFLGISMAARTMHASNQTTQLMFYAITQMASKGTVSMEELRRQLGEKLPGTMQLAAASLHTTADKLQEAIKKGSVDSIKFLDVFSSALIRTYSDSSKVAADSVSAAMNRLTNVWVDFSKAVIDSGAGKAIISVFDALRDKLSDPYLIQRFADLVKYLAEKFAEFIRGLTQDDIRNGFDTLTKGIEFAVKVIGKLIDAFTWIINNAPKAGGAIGAVGGALAGASVGGGWGALIGAIGGGAGGYYAGKQLQSTPAEEAARKAQDQAAQLAKELQRKEQEELKYNNLLPILGMFKGLQNFNGLDNLFKAENLNNKELEDLTKILADKRFKTDQDKVSALREYAKTGAILAPDNAQLKDVLNGQAKQTAEEKRLERHYWQAFGFSAEFKQEAEDFITLYKGGKLTLEQLDHAMADLLNKQPFMEKWNKQQAEQNKQLEEMIDQIIKKTEFFDKLKTSLDLEQKRAAMRAEDAAIEAKVDAIILQAQEKHITLTEKELDQYREKYRLINETQQVEAAAEQIRSQTTDRFKGQTNQLKAFDKLMSNPQEGFTKDDAQDYLVKQNPQMFAGTEEETKSVERKMKDMYAFINGLRQKDLISEQTAQKMRVQAWTEANAANLHSMDTLWTNLAALQSSKNKDMARIGKAAAIVQTTIKTYEAATSAYAAMAGIPYIGPVLGAAAAAAAIAAGLANVQAIKSQSAGFMTGGYTGNGPLDEPAGVVHGQEFVVNAASTQRYRPLLEQINSGSSIASGATATKQKTSEGGGGIVVNIENHGTSKTFETQQVSANEVRIIARDEARAMIAKEVPNVVAGEIADPNSRTSKAINRHTQASRRR